MLQLQLFLLRTGIFKIGRPFTGLLSKLFWFIRLADWVSANKDIPFNDFPTRPEYAKRYQLYEYLLKEHLGARAIVYLELGVADGETFGWWIERLRHPDSRFYGFDTFEGLPEDWGTHKKGSFSNQGKIPVFNDERYFLYKGLFQETLPPFLADLTDNHPKLILLDADLYSSTLFALTALAPRLRTGDILLFDEFFSPQHEFRAFHDFLQAYTRVKLKLIAAANNYNFTAFLVTVHRHPE